MAAPRIIFIDSPTDPASPLSYSTNATALLLCDFHGFLVSLFPNANSTFMPATKSMLEWARMNNVLVIHGLMKIEDGLTPPETSKSSKRWPTYLKMFATNPEAAKEPVVLRSPESSGEGEMVWERVPGTVSALKAEGLVEFLRERGIKSLVAMGLSTSGCLLSTIRDASDQGFVVTVIEDACVDPGKGVHEVLRDSVLPMTANVIASYEWQELWGKK